MGMEQVLTTLGKATENLTLASFLLITFLLLVFSLIPILAILSRRIIKFKYKDIQIEFHKEDIKKQIDEPSQIKITSPELSLATTSPETPVLHLPATGSSK